jgi:hypothetical protein
LPRTEATSEIEALGADLSRESQIATVTKQRLYMSSAGTLREVRTVTGGLNHRPTDSLLGIASRIGGTEHTSWFEALTVIAWLYYQVQGTSRNAPKRETGSALFDGLTDA